MVEIWKDIKGYEGLYQVSNLGNIKSLNYNRKGISKILKQGLEKGGYLRISLSKNKKSKTKAVHRLVAEAFIPNPDNLPQVNHKNEDKTDNNVNNLEWCNVSYNINYGTRTERCGKSSNKVVLQFDSENNLIKKWKSTMEASRNGFSSGHISDCCNGKSKTHKGFIWRYEDEK